MIVFKLAGIGLVRQPLRILLALGVLAATSALIAWMVASYDAMIAQYDEAASEVMGRQDFFLLAPREPDVGVTPERLAAFTDDARVAGVYPVVSFNLTLSPPRGEGGPGFGPGGPGAPGERGGRGGGMPPPNMGPQPASGAAQGAARPIQAAPPQEGARVADGAGMPIQKIVLAPVASEPGASGGGSRFMGRGGTATYGTDAPTSPFEMSEGLWVFDPLPSDAVALDEWPCVLTAGVARRLERGVGDALVARGADGPVVFRIVGLMEEPIAANRYSTDVPGAAPRNRHNPPAAGMYLRMNDALILAELFGLEAPTTSALVRLHNAGDRAAVKAAAVGRGESAELLLSYDAVIAGLEESSADGNARMQAYGATGLSILVSFFIIFTTLSMGVEERIRQFALLRAVALRKGQLLGVVLLESVLLGVAGWLAGLAAGVLVLQLTSPDGFWRIGLWTVLLSGVCALSGSVLAGLYPAWRATRIKPLDAATERTVTATARGRASPVVAVVGLVLVSVNFMISYVPGIPESTRSLLYGLVGGPLMMAGFVCLAPAVVAGCRGLLGGVLARLFRLEPAFLRSQLRANYWRGVGTVVSLSVGLGLYMMVRIWTASALVAYQPGAWLPDALAIVTPRGLSLSDMDAVRALPGVRPEHALPIALEQPKLADNITEPDKHSWSAVRQDNVVIVGLDPDAGYGGSDPLLDFPFVAGSRAEAVRRMKTLPHQVLIPKHFARVTGLGLDGVLTLLPPGDPDRRIEFTVAGIVDDMGWAWFSKTSGVRRNTGRSSGMVYGVYDDVAKAFDLTSVNYLWMDFAPGADENAIRSGLERLAGVVQTRGDGAESRGRPGRGDGEDGAGRGQTVRMTTATDIAHSLNRRATSVIEAMVKMPLLILLVTSLAVMNTAAASIRTRRWEIGVMRACGLSGSGLLRLFLAEAVLLGVAASVLSFTYGLASGLCYIQMSTFVSFFGGMGWTFDIPVLKILHGVGITLGLCLLAALVPAFLASRTQPLRLLAKAD